jgi:hypothetical protein
MLEVIELGIGPWHDLAGRERPIAGRNERAPNLSHHAPLTRQGRNYGRSVSNWWARGVHLCIVSAVRAASVLDQSRDGRDPEVSLPMTCIGCIVSLQGNTAIHPILSALLSCFLLHCIGGGAIHPKTVFWHFRCERDCSCGINERRDQRMSRIAVMASLKVSCEAGPSVMGGPFLFRAPESLYLCR